jgi:hypothetical protein
MYDVCCVMLTFLEVRSVFLEHYCKVDALYRIAWRIQFTNDLTRFRPTRLKSISEEVDT